MGGASDFFLGKAPDSFGKYIFARTVWTRDMHIFWNAGTGSIKKFKSSIDQHLSVRLAVYISFQEVFMINMANSRNFL